MPNEGSTRLLRCRVHLERSRLLNVKYWPSNKAYIILYHDRADDEGLFVDAIVAGIHVRLPAQCEADHVMCVYSLASPLNEIFIHCSTYRCLQQFVESVHNMSRFGPESSTADLRDSNVFTKTSSLIKISSNEKQLIAWFRVFLFCRKCQLMTCVVCHSRLNQAFSQEFAFEGCPIIAEGVDVQCFI